MSTDPNTPDFEGSGGGWIPIILAIVISVIALFLVVPNSRRHASSMDEPIPSAATETAPATAAAPAKQICCDMPKADKTTLQMLAVFAEHEARAIGERTRLALAAAKARGVKLGGRRAGSPALTDAMRKQSLKVRLERADEFAADVALQLAKLKAEGATSLAQLASGLNALGIATARGTSWTPTAVARVLKRT